MEHYFRPGERTGSRRKHRESNGADGSGRIFCRGRAILWPDCEGAERLKRRKRNRESVKQGLRKELNGGKGGRKISGKSVMEQWKKQSYVNL